MKVAIIGGGAAGFFAAINVKENYPQAQVTIFEKTSKLLTKVKISGGGRCNLTHASPSISELLKAYPRGTKVLKRAFHSFNNTHTIEWFKARGVAVCSEADGRVFPASNTSQTIVDCLLAQVEKLQISIKYNCQISSLTRESNQQLALSFNRHTNYYDKVIAACGGASQLRHLNWLAELGHSIEPPVPSLFTLNMPDESITQLPGIVAHNTRISLPGTKLAACGATLITHWGLSGPAVLKFSAFAARILHEKNYEFAVQVNWLNQRDSMGVVEQLHQSMHEYQKKLIRSGNPFGLAARLWHYLLARSGISLEKTWENLGTKGVNKLSNVLTNDLYAVQGKPRFKEEFVTCGGVSLNSVNIHSLESKVCPGLYFAGEILDIDGITGGYNFQAAWTSAYIAAQFN
jgi:predicted Rossmann fold flavoprotein